MVATLFVLRLPQRTFSKVEGLFTVLMCAELVAQQPHLAAGDRLVEVAAARPPPLLRTSGERAR